MSEPTWLLLGASSAIGRALARLAAERGRVILAGRNIEDMERTASDLRIRAGRRVDVMALDVLAVETHQDFAAEIAAQTEILNVVVLFAAMPEQEEIEKDPTKALACIAVTYTGAVSILQHFAVHLENKGSGVVIGFGSVAGDRGRLKNYVYGSAKAGLHTYLSGLRSRLRRKGIHVMTVKPGFVDTGMTWGRPGVFFAAKPEDIARSCLRAADRQKDVVYLPTYWKWIMLAVRSIPESLFKRLPI